MSSEELARSIWYEVHDGLREWVQPYVSVLLGRRLASEACGLWVRNAADGKVPTTCAYALAYEAMRHVLAEQPGMIEGGLPAGLEPPMQSPTSLLPYQMSKLYWDVWKASELLHWDQKIRNRASKGVSSAWPWGPHQCAGVDVEGLSPLAGPLGRRAVAVLVEHECLDCAICTEAAVKWEDEDKRTEQYFTARRQQREE